MHFVYLFSAKMDTRAPKLKQQWFISLWFYGMFMCLDLKCDERV